MMFKRVLIANRGEIAVRVMMACQELGIETVAVYSEVDAESPHVHIATQAVCLGPPAPAESYLNIDKIIQAAKDTGAEAIHPGYGFLSENPVFAARCEKEGITFIGPSPRVIELMGNKIASKETMEGAGVPVIPGYNGKDQDTRKLAEAGARIGFPVMVKAAAGGGGKGMHVVRHEKDLVDAIDAAKRESKSAFGDDTVFLERYLDQPRHIEFQILGDAKGNVVHLFERECSIQRRHQKVIEETPSPALTPEKREEMGRAAVAAAKAIDYTNAGTVEFMYSNGEFYFLEMNTRLQVEHPITEATTGIDLVKWQLRIASGQDLTLKQEDLSQRGHAIECRIYAEDPENDFMPSPGMVYRFEPAYGVNVRHDTGIESGLEVSPFYDPMLAKLTVHGENREDAIQKMVWALSNYVALGVTTNISFLKEVVQHPAFKSGEITTHFIGEHFKGWNPSAEGLPEEVLISAALMEYLHKGQMPKVTGDEPYERDPHSPWTKAGRWRIGE